MTNQMVLFVVNLTINEGSFDQFEAVVKATVDGSRKEPGTLAYEWCLSADRRRCRLIEVYEDADAVLAHLAGPVVRELVPKLLAAASLGGFEVYGDPGPEAARILAGFGADLFAPWRGLNR
jgi:quinol monooxygenase YgiN